MATPVTSATAPSGAASPAPASSAAAGSPQTLDQNAFLKLLMAQLSNQDPLQPMQGTEFVTQLSQFSLVEQSVNQSTQLGKITSQLQGLGNSDATALVGKTVTVRGNGMQWDGTFATTANVTLAGPAASVTATVKDSQGNTVRTMTLGAEPGGVLPITWDGRDDSGQPAPAGSYSVSVGATDATGRSVAVSQTATGVVTAVSFDKGYPEMTLGTGAVAPVSQLVSVSSGAASAPAAQ